MLQEATFAVHLLCAVSFSMSDTSTTSINPGYGQLPVTGEIVSRQQVQGEVRVRFGEQNRIRLPHQIVRARDDGWRELTDIEIADERIVAKFQYKFAEAGTLEIDRMNGEVRARMGNMITGYYTLVGKCTSQEMPRERLF